MVVIWVARIVACAVHYVVVPYILVVVNISDEQSSAWQFSIPVCPVSVFEQVILVGISLVVYDITLATIVYSLHVAYYSVVNELYRLFPSAHHSLVGSIASRAIAVAVVASRTHQVPAAHANMALICDIVGVREAEAVRELVAHGADARHVSVAIYLVAASVSVDKNSVKFHFFSIFGFRELPLMRPDSVFISAISLSTSCIEEVNLVYFAITVPVIFCKVNIVVGKQESLRYHRSRAHVVAISIIFAVVGIVIGKCYRTYNVEVQVENTLTLRQEVVANTAAKLSVAESYFVYYALIA